MSHCGEMYSLVHIGDYLSPFSVTRRSVADVPATYENGDYSRWKRRQIVAVSDASVARLLSRPTTARTCVKQAVKHQQSKLL